MEPNREYVIKLRRPHLHQKQFIDSKVKRKVVRAGRRGGKTVGAAQLAVKVFLTGRRILYGAPTQDQVDAFWWEVKRALAEPIDAGIYYKNESLHIIELPGTKNRIRAKTCWNADTLRGDYADLLILDEWQLMNEEAWELVGAPMLLDNNGDAVFIYTPPSQESRSVSKARDPRHAAKLFKRAAADNSGRWQAFHFRSSDNPHISRVALAELTKDMTRLAIRQEIEAEDLDEIPNALFKREHFRYFEQRGSVYVLGKPDGAELVPAENCLRFSTMDLAASTKTSADYTVYATWTVTPKMDLLLLDVLRARMEGADHKALVRSAYTKWCPQLIGIEKAFGGLTLIQEMTRAGLPVVGLDADKDKYARALPAAARMEQGAIYLLAGAPWLPEWEEEHLEFPFGEHDDQVDCTAYAARFLSTLYVEQGEGAGAQQQPIGAREAFEGSVSPV